MSINIGYIIIGIFAGVIIGYLMAKMVFWQATKGHRKDAIAKSRATTLGYVSEKIAPLLPNFPYHYKDLVFLGKGVDYIAFDGLSEGQVREIAFIEIKTGTSQLNKNEAMIKSAIEQKRVSWTTVRI